MAVTRLKQNNQTQDKQIIDKKTENLTDEDIRTLVVQMAQQQGYLKK